MFPDRTEGSALTKHRPLLGLLAGALLADILVGCAPVSGPISLPLDSRVTKAPPMVEKVTAMPSSQCLEKPPSDVPSLKTCLDLNGLSGQKRSSNI